MPSASLLRRRPMPSLEGWARLLPLNWSVFSLWLKVRTQQSSWVRKRSRKLLGLLQNSQFCFWQDQLGQFSVKHQKPLRPSCGAFDIPNSLCRMFSSHSREMPTRLAIWLTVLTSVSHPSRFCAHEQCFLSYCCCVVHTCHHLRCSPCPSYKALRCNIRRSSVP